MRVLRRLVLGLLSLLLVSSAVFSWPNGGERASAQAASSYSYGTVNTNSDRAICDAQPGNESDEALVITETTLETDSGSSFTSYWCYVPGTAYQFARNNSSARIAVSGTAPEQGSLQESDGQTSTIAIGNTNVFTQYTTSNPDNTAAEEAQTCESNEMGWLVCPIIRMMSGGLNWLDTRIQNLLQVDENRYTNPQLKQAWVNFRNIAYIILIPVMLVMVVGTALDFEVFSAYTVKKALPRMVLAVVFITFSWHIVTFLIGFFNVMGAGVLGLMTSPFNMGNSMSLDTLFGTSSSNGGDIASTAGSAAVQWAAGGAVLLGLAAMITAPGGLPILLLYLVPIVMFVLLAFAVLLLREIFILAAVLLAPLAILAWIFPGNDSLWKLWWGTFNKLLLMFPLIMLIIGAGRIAAHLIDISGGGSVQALVNPLLKLTAYILPYAFIPFTFKFAGGLFANLAGIVNDRERGILDRAKKARGEKWGEFGRRGGRNSLFDPRRAENAKGLKGRWMRGVNSAGGWIFDPMSNANIKLGTEKGKAILSQVWQGKAEDTQKLAEVMGRMSFNAEELSTLSLGRKIKIRDGNTIREVEIGPWDGTGKGLEHIADMMSRGVDAQDRIGGKHLRENAGFLTQVTRSEEYGRADVRGAAGLAYAAQGFAKPDEIARLANELGAGGSGVGSILKTQAELLSARAGGLGKPGYGVRIGADGQYYAPSGIDGAKIEQVVRTGVQDLSSAKGNQLTKQLGPALEHILTAAENTAWVDAGGNQRTIGEIKTGVEETLVQVMGSYAPPDVKRRIYEVLVNAKKQTLIGTTRTTRTTDAAGNEVLGSVVVTADNAAQFAEADVRALLSRSSGAIDPAKLGFPSDEANDKR